MESKWSHIVNPTPEMAESLSKGCVNESSMLNIDVEIMLKLFGEHIDGMPMLYGRPYLNYLRNLNI